MQPRIISLLLSLVVLDGAAQVAPAAADDLNSYFKPVKWRSIGPFRGGRSNASSGVGGDPNKVSFEGHYEDVYEKTPQGWRFKSRVHHGCTNCPAPTPRPPATR